MEGKIKIIMDEDMVWERFHMVRPKMKGIRYLRILGLVYVIPATAWLIYRMVRRYQAADKQWMPSILLIIICLGASWFCIWGYSLVAKGIMKKGIREMTLPVECVISFDEETITMTSEKQMRKAAWKNIRHMCENENYWLFSKLLIPVDKRMLTEEEFAFFREKSDEIKFYDELF